NIFFFFQAEDGIRDYKVTGVQTCALPISKTEEHDLSYQDGFFTTCFQSCHSFQKRMASGSWDEEGWRARVKYMRDTMMAGERARLTDEEVEDFTSYLTAAFGPKSPKPQSPEDL